MLPGQLDMLELIEARKLRDEGMALAAHAQGQRWSDMAYAAIKAVAQRQVHVSINDVLREGTPEPVHPNAWGHVWLRAIREGIIQRTNQTVLCTVHKRKHAHRYPVYFSRIYDPRSV